MTYKIFITEVSPNNYIETNLLKQQWVIDSSAFGGIRIILVFMICILPALEPAYILEIPILSLLSVLDILDIIVIKA